MPYTGGKGTACGALKQMKTAFRWIGSYARLLRVFVIRDLREQYAGTLAGGAWAILQPIMMVFIYWWVFGFVWSLKVPILGARGGELPFIVFLLATLLPWLAFQDAVNKASTAVLARADVLRQGNFAVEVFPLARAIAAHAVFLILLICFILIGRGSIMLSAPALLFGVFALFAVQVLVACGVSLVVAALTVYVRDLPHVLGMALMGVFFTAPILYPMTQIPEAMRGWVWLNPYTPFAMGFHALILEGNWPAMTIWAYVLTMAVVALTAGLFVFRRLRPGFADVV